MKNEKLQSRREFFKNVAKATLPILGIAFLIDNHIIANTTEAWNCKNSCSSTCSGGCTGGCSKTCLGSCSGSCSDSCTSSSKK